MDDEDAGLRAGPIDSRRLSPVRKTVTALVATSLLFVAACADERDGTLGDPDRSTSTTTSTSTPETTEPDGSTTSTTPGDPNDPTNPGNPGDPTNPDDDPGNNEVCEGQTPVWAFAPTDPAGPKSAPRAELASYGRASTPSPAQQQPQQECTTPEPQLGTGDIQITLRWNSSADLDLHVTEPNGTEIWYSDKGTTSTGGRLDVDSNVGCEEDGSVENVFWPEGQAPEGQFLVEVDGYRVDGCGGGQYTVVANVRGREVLRETGSVAEDETDSYHFEA
jgi:hypothetical protein